MDGLIFEPCWHAWGMSALRVRTSTPGIRLDGVSKTWFNIWRRYVLWLLYLCSVWFLLIQLETFHGEGSSETHGYAGPIHVSDGGSRGPNSQSDILAAAKMAGCQQVRDLQGLRSNIGFGAAWSTVSPDGKRQDTAHCYLHPRLQDGRHSNLHVLVDTKVVRVIFNKDRKASAVEIVPSPG